jgi:hypothetical protein
MVAGLKHTYIYSARGMAGNKYTFVINIAV